MKKSYNSCVVNPLASGGIEGVATGLGIVLWGPYPFWGWVCSDRPGAMLWGPWPLGG